MDINIHGNPGTGNTFQEIHIGTVETYAPQATTVNNIHYGDRKAPPTAPDTALQQAERIQRQAEILQYVGNLKPFVASVWKNRYDNLWRSILDLAPVKAAVFDFGKQKNTSFNRILVANIIYIMCNAGVFITDNASEFAQALEGNKEHSVRGELRKEPKDPEIVKAVKALTAS